jgi:serine/threonine protein kinase
MLDLLVRILDISVDVASALECLHEDEPLPIIHCDLKPSNILLNDDMVAHVGDFGLARFYLLDFHVQQQDSTCWTFMFSRDTNTAPENQRCSESVASNRGQVSQGLNPGRRPKTPISVGGFAKQFLSPKK